MALMVAHAVSDFESWTSAFDASQTGPLVEVRREQEPIAYQTALLSSTLLSSA